MAADAERVTARQRAILAAVIESYVATGEPVSSGSIARSCGDVGGMSAATVRNEMVALTDTGMLEQPHTSAGRIPTARAFRVYVDELSGVARKGLPAHSRREIDLRFEGIAGTEAILERTSHVLATLSSGVGVAIATVADGDLLEHVHFSRLAPARVLAVVVTKSGMVRDRVLALDRDFEARELEGASAFLNESYRGWSVERVRTELARRVEQERSEYQRMLTAVEQLWAGANPETRSQAVYVGGVGNLVRGVVSEADFSPDSDRLREVLSALEAKQRLVELLNAYIDARQESVRVVFDLEEQAPEMAGLVLIAAPARVGGEQRGTVGVIGTKRIDYERTMDAVSYLAGAFDRILHPSG